MARGGRLTPRCAHISAALPESPAATAPVARRWLALEQPGPWGRQAVLDSHLDRLVAAEIVRHAAAADATVILIRRPGAHPDPRLPVPRHVYIAETTPGSARLTHAVLDDPKELLDVDLETGFSEPVAGPVALVCTNARRDQCCAIDGRPLALALAGAGVHVWESSHLSGHRFAPTMLVLPHGLAYARQTPASAATAIDAAAAGRVVLDRYRGRTTWQRPAQAAEIAVRQRLGELSADALEVVEGTDHAEVTVQHRDGRTWAVRVVREEGGQARPESCGKQPVRFEQHRAVTIRSLAAP